jgi:hypothetical protein
MPGDAPAAGAELLAAAEEIIAAGAAAGATVRLLGGIAVFNLAPSARAGFTYTVLDPDGRVVGCVYIYPAKDEEGAPAGEAAPGVADVHSWVRADRAELDVPLYAAVSAWLADAWPFAEVRYAPRAGGGGGTAGTGP